MKSFGPVVNIIFRVAIVFFLAEVILNQTDPRFVEKAIPIRNLIIVLVFTSALPFLYFLKKKMRGRLSWKRYPFWYDNLYLSIFLLDMAGNSFNLYDSYYYFDLIPHLHGPGALSVVLLGLFGLPFLSAIGLTSVVHTLLEAQEYYTDVLFGTENVRGVFDITNDLAVGIAGSIIYIVLFRFLGKYRDYLR